MTHAHRLITIPAPSRRGFLGVSLGAGLTLAFPFAKKSIAAEAGADFTAYVHIGADDSVSIVAPGAELGQGVYTTLPKILCEELEADWERVQVKLAVGDDAAYGNPAKRGRQSTGNSDAVAGYFEHLRKVGASAKEMLIAAAAQSWRVPASDCRAQNGMIFHDASGRSTSFGTVAVAASKLPMPEAPALKPREQWTLIGKTVPRKDTPAKVDGSAQFGADVALPGMLVATLKTCPAFGGKVVSFDDTAVRAMPGVEAVVKIDNGSGTEGVAVAADNYWHALKAVEALAVVWDTAGNDHWNSAAMDAAFTAALDDAGQPFPGAKGDVAAAMAGAAKTFAADYAVPYLAHACMEPMCATVLVTDDECRVWAPAQQQGGSRDLAAELTGLPVDKVTLQGTFAGGGFGRKWELDFIRQAVQTAMAVKGRPVRFMWSREEDIRKDYFRPAYTARMRGALDADGNLTALHAKITGTSILAFQKRPAKVPDPTAVGGIINPRYETPNTLIEYVEQTNAVPVGFWRSVALSQNGFVAESAIDELAHLAGKDPLEFRRTLLKDKPRELDVLDAVAEMSGWGRALPPGRGLGIAFSYGFDAVIAQVAEVSVTDGDVKVEKVWCAYDCGLVVDPGTVEAQMESGIAFGLSAALFGEITLAGGQVQQSNFHDYEMVTMATMPEVEVRLIEGADKPGGAGEAAVPPVAPAVANAIFAATGRRIRRLPLRAAGLGVA